MAKYIIYRGNKYVRVDSARSMVDISDSLTLIKRGEEMEKFLLEKVTKIFSGIKLGPYLKQASNSKAVVQFTIRGRGDEQYLTFDITTPKLAAPENALISSDVRVQNNEEVVAAELRRICRAGHINFRQFSSRVLFLGRGRWAYKFHFATPEGEIK